METEKIAVILFTLAFLAMVITIAVYELFTVIDVKTIEMKVKLGDYVGFNLNDKYLEFGTVVPGSYAQKSIQMTNDYDFPILVQIDFIPQRDADFFINRNGVMKKEWVSVSENNFILGANETKIIAFTVVPEKGMPLGNYTGLATIKFLYVQG